MKTRHLSVLALIAAAVTAAAFLPILTAGFTNWDDQIMIYQNTKIMSLSWSNIVTFFTSFHERLYHPLVLLSYAVEYRLAGMNPHVFHATSYGLHILNTLLVFWFLNLLTGSNFIAFVVSLLFGIHPMHVESAAWLAERKDVLYSFFYLAALVTYVKYVREKDKRYLIATLALFILSLLSKSMAVTLPFVMLLCDYFLGRKIEMKAIGEKSWFFALSLIFAVVTVIGHYEPGVKGRAFTYSLYENIMTPFQHVVFYLIKVVWPSKLSCVYPAVDKISYLPHVLVMLSPLIVLCLAAAVALSARHSKTVVFGSLFFIIVISPVLQFLPVGIKVPADRYTYIAAIGLFYMFAVLAEYLLKVYKVFVIVFLAVIFSIFFALTWQRTLVYHDSVSLWEDTLKNYRNIPVAYYNLATFYFLDRWDFDRALPLYTEAIKADPQYTEAYINYGLINYYKHDYATAIEYYDKAEKTDPAFPEIYLNRGNAYSSLNMQQKALAEYGKAIKYRPDSAEAWYNRANVYRNIGNNPEAIAGYSRALALKSDYTDALNNRGTVYFAMKHYDQALDDFNSTIAMSPNFANAYYNRALVFGIKGDVRGALNDLLKAKLLGMKIDDSFLEKVRREAR